MFTVPLSVPAKSSVSLSPVSAYSFSVIVPPARTVVFSIAPRPLSPAEKTR